MCKTDMENVQNDFVFIGRLLFELSRKNTETQKHGKTETHTDSDEYSIVAFCKNATIIKIHQVIQYLYIFYYY